MTTLKVNLNIRTTKKEKTDFQRACKKSGHQQSDVLRKMMARYAAGDIKFTEIMETS